MNVIIYGAGGHGKVVAQVLEAAGFTIIGFIDDKPERKYILNYPLLGEKELLSNFPNTSVIVAIGDNAVRKAIFAKVKEFNLEVVTAVHPFTCIHKTVKIGRGTVVMPGVVVNVDTVIGENCILNTSASIDHDCQIGDHVHIAPQSALGGGVIVGEESFIGIGSTILPGLKIGKRAMVGGGAVVIKDVPDYATVVGVPAKILKTLEEI